jgi:curved DNA-binding protein CbpA
MEAAFDPYYKWLGIRPQDRPITAYRLLGVTPDEDDCEVIDQAADRQMAFLRSHQTGPHAELSQKLLNEVAKARLLLLDPKRRSEYDRKLAQQRRAATPPPAPPPPSSVAQAIAPPQAVAPPPVAVAVPVMAAPVAVAIPHPHYPPPPSSIAGPSSLAPPSPMAAPSDAPYIPAVPGGYAMPAGPWPDEEDSQDVALSSLFQRAQRPGSGFDSVTSGEVSGMCYARRKNLSLWWIAMLLAGTFLAVAAGATLVAAG